MSDNNQNIQVSGILICGRVSLLSPEFLEQMAQNYQVIVAGRNDMQSRMNKIHIYDIDIEDEKFTQLFDAWQIDAVIYVSEYADGMTAESNNVAVIDKIMTCCRFNMVSKLVVLSSMESINFQAQYGFDGEIVKRKFASGMALGSSQFEDTIRYYAKSIDQRTIILRLPYLVSDMKNENFLSGIFRSITDGEPVTFPYSKENRVDILSAYDLAELLTDVLEEDMDTSVSYNVSSGYHYTWGSLEKALKEIVPGSVINYANGTNYMSIQSFPIELKRKYGFVPLDNVLELLPEYYDAYRKRVQKERNFFHRSIRAAKHFAENHLIGYLEMIVLFFLAQLLLKTMGQNVYFKYIDIRLLFVLLMGSVHGMQVGILSGILECVSLFFNYKSLGITGTMLFYNQEYWLPFAIYLMTGSVTGYMRSRYLKKIQFQKDENDNLRDRYLFLNDVYHGAIENKADTAVRYWDIRIPSVRFTKRSEN